ncbi:TolC family protein [Parapedobacter deserti]|uniref:TolC family protein n=1 Tax=Parapedobacter deserti TaxID=1912957 RepID=A0ABV7JLR8_9SPHI
MMNRYKNQALKSLRGVMWLTAVAALTTSAASGQERAEHRLTLDEAVELAMENHQQLKLSKANVSLNRAQQDVAKQQRLPTATFSASALYLGDALVLNTDFSKLQTVEMPHFGNSFAVQASQLLYKGGAITKSIELAGLQTQLVELDLENDMQSIKFLVISNYLDICRVLNQLQVFEQNRVLAEQRLANVLRQYEQDMVTRNEVIRGELQIKNLEQSILTARNNHAILSNQLAYALGLPADVLVRPADPIGEPRIQAQSHYVDLARRAHPVIRSANQQIGMAEKNVSLIKTDRLPAVSAFGGYNMQRPLTTGTPVMDLYNNTWQVGVSLNYTIDNLFRTKKRIQVGERQTVIAQEALELTLQNIDIGINAAYTKYREAVQQEKLMEESKRLANENYHIVEAKYLNQLAITAEMTDATNAKLEAELQHANAAIGVLFQYYNLLKSTGTL